MSGSHCLLIQQGRVHTIVTVPVPYSHVDQHDDEGEGHQRVYIPAGTHSQVIRDSVVSKVLGVPGAKPVVQ